MHTPRTLLTTLLCLVSLLATAQNPIIRDQFTADPTARVFHDRLYLFPSHDIPDPGDAPRKEWFCMADYHVFSSDNLTDWTDHGVIISQEEVPWGAPKGYAMWAPDCVEKEGKYYFYFPDAPREGKGFGIGVAVSNLPDGKYTLQSEPIKGLYGIDPCVLQCSNGDAYIFVGGGFIGMAKLTPDMLAIEGELQPITTLPKGFVEGPFAFEREGRYYLTFPWVESTTETLAYAMADSPTGPYEFKGKIMEASSTGCWTNHHSIVEYRGQWYLFYHHNDYSPSFDKLRSACCDSLFFNSDGTIRPVRPTLRGVGITDALSAPIHPDRYSICSATGVTVDLLTPDTVAYFSGWQITYAVPSAFSTYNSVSFARKAKTLTLRVNAPEGATLRITATPRPQPALSAVEASSLRRPTSDVRRPSSSLLRLPATDGYQLITLPLRRSPRGLVDLRFETLDSHPLTLDWIQYSR